MHVIFFIKKYRPRNFLSSETKGTSIVEQHQRWNLIPDEEGKLHVIDANPIEDVENFFNPEEDTKFFLFTRDNPHSGQELTTVESIRESHFDPTAPVRILIHGFNSGLSSGTNVLPTRSYLQLGNFNVIQARVKKVLSLQKVIREMECREDNLFLLFYF